AATCSPNKLPAMPRGRGADRRSPARRRLVARRRRRSRRHRRSRRSLPAGGIAVRVGARGAPLRRAAAVYLRLRTGERRHRRHRGAAHELASRAGRRARRPRRLLRRTVVRRLRARPRRRVPRVAHRLPLAARRALSTRAGINAGAGMTRGLRQIVRLNWPFYVAAAGVAIAGPLLTRALPWPSWTRLLLDAGAALVGGWLVA